MTSPILRLACAAAILLAVSPAAAAAEPEVTAVVRDTADVWRNLEGGESVGWTSLNKLQVAASWSGAFGDPGLRLHLQLFRTNGERLTSRTGDLQTASNIEAISTTRLFEAFAEQGFGDPKQPVVVLRAGLIDLNSGFDSIDPAGLFVDSSHGIGPDLSKSGRNGPSIFPVSALGVRAVWTVAPDWTLSAAAFDGVPGDPAHPRSLVRVRLSADDGVLGIAQLDRKLGQDGQASLGVWRYTAGLPRLDGPGRDADQGVYGFVEGPAPGLDGWRGWVRAGVAPGAVQTVTSYLGAGLTRQGLLPGRPDDRMGVAVARAGVSRDARRLAGLPRAETDWEATYQLKAGRLIALQPDVQYIVHPATAPGLRNALAVGLRVLFIATYPPPAKAPAADPAQDPTEPSSPPQP